MLLTSIENRKIFTLIDANGAETDALIQAIPPAKWRELFAGLEKPMRKEQLTKRPVDGMVRRWQNAGVEAASFALIDFNPSRTAGRESQLPVQDEKTAQIVSKALGKEVQIGTVVTLDGHWTVEVKEHVFREMPGGPGLADWIVKQAKKLGLEIAEDEEGKD